MRSRRCVRKLIEETVGRDTLKVWFSSRESREGMTGEEAKKDK